MPRKKKVEAPAAEAEVKAVETAEAAPAPAKKTTARKTTAAKKVAAEVEPKKAAVAIEPEPKKAAVSKAKAAKAPAKSEVIIEYGKQVSVDEIVKNARNIVGEDKDITVYVKPEESKAYIVSDGNTVQMDVYFWAE